MKKVLVLVSCVAVLLILSKVSFAESEEVSVEPEALPAQKELSELSAEGIIGEVQSDGITVWRQLHPVPPPHALTFGVMPYPTTATGQPAYGIPYSYPSQPREPRRLGRRLAPPPFQPHPLPGIGVALPPPSSQPPTVVYRPTPIKNFATLIMAPRPYVAYDPYAVYPTHPLYVPVQ